MIWWNTPYRTDNQDNNPWNKYVIPSPIDEWSNPWKYDDLRKYGVDVFPGRKMPTFKDEYETF